MRKKITSWTLLLVCNTMWALQFTCIKLTQDQVGPYFTVWMPMLVSALLLAPVIVKDVRLTSRSIKDIGSFIRLGLLGAFPAQVFMTWGTQYSLASNAAIITLALPVISVVFAYVLLKEKMNVMRWLSLLIAIVGVVLCSTGEIKQSNFGSRYAVGNILIFMAVIGNAYYNTGVKKIAERYSEMQLIFYTYVVLVILLTPFVFFFESDVFARMRLFTRQTWVGLSLLTVFHNFLSMVLFFKALKVLDAMQVALSNYLITFIGLAIVAVWLKENLNSQVIAGGVLVFVSTLAITLIDYRISGNSYKGVSN